MKKTIFRIKNYIDSFRFSWQNNGILGQRLYLTYEDYLNHQKSKVEYLDLTRHDEKFGKFLNDKLKSFDFIKTGINVLCLGARSGIEVKVFRDLGCFAVGIDLKPTPENEFVTYGDFHNLKFADGCVDLIYTNSIDHSLMPNKLGEEVKRVLRPGGFFLLELVDQEPGEYEAFSWKNNNELLKFIPLDVYRREEAIFWGKTKPRGEYIVFQKSKINEK